MRSLFLVLFLTSVTFSQKIITPLEKSDFTELSTHKNLVNFVLSLHNIKPYIKVDSIGHSVEGRVIPVVKVSKDSFNPASKKVTLLIFAQQHGDEQGGKEAALLFLKKIAEGKLDTLLNRLNLLVVPQINPDGSERNNRLNANNMDLNRSHLMLSEPETEQLHRLFYEYYPEATLDVHEYYPYTKDWEDFGAFKSFDVQLGTVTNLNITEEIHELSVNGFIPFARDYLTEKKISFHNYIVGGPPNTERIRHSTTDINDGRQSFGILNTFSVIQEGLNGKDTYSNNIKRRAETQAAAIECFVNFCYYKAEFIKTIVNHGRGLLTDNRTPSYVSLRMEHYPAEKILEVKLKSSKTEKDTIVKIEKYHPHIKSLLEVKKPYGYLIPAEAYDLLTILSKHAIVFSDYSPKAGDIIEQYKLTGLDTVEVEELPLVSPTYIPETSNTIDNPDSYYLVKLNQIQSTFITLALEPRSQWGILTYTNLSQRKAFDYYGLKRLFRQE